MPDCALDERLLLIARTRGHTPALDRAAAVYSRLGEHAAGWIALGLVGAALARNPGRRRAWLTGVRAVGSAYVANQAVKFTVRRRRPVLAGLPPLTSTVTSLSFPSAHSTTAFAAARAYRGLVPAAVLYALATAVALSRPYLGVHYPSDVVAGAALGTVVGETLRCR